jgi:hypothetical protein
MKEFISTVCLGREIHLVWRPERDEISSYLSRGFVPVEMAEGQESFVDFRCLDHHNAYSRLPSACVTALKYYGSLGSPARMMVNHTDADCVLAGLTLMGLLPWDVLKKLNAEVGVLDTDPMSADKAQLFYSEAIHLWKMGMTSAKQSGWSWLYGLQLFLDIFRNADDYAGVKCKISEMEQKRVRLALEDYEKAVCGTSGKILLIAPSRAHGFDVQFHRQAEFLANSLEGWRHWCLIAYVEKSRNVTISCPNQSVAELAFGPGGLLSVYPELPAIDGKEWGGREAVGGSPRGVVFPADLLPKVLETTEKILKIPPERDNPVYNL